jgi:hypothetical protein
MAKSKLEELSDIYRVQNLIKNDYQKVEGSSYSVTHKNAISDGDAKGKGTGVVGDTYNGGSDVDIYGNPSIPKTGRLQLTSQNMYDSENEYTVPDTSENADQFRSL